MSTALPRWTSVYEGGSFVPCCELCGWIGKDRWTIGTARKACHDHARTKRHREDAAAYAQREREHSEDLPDS